MPRSQPHRPAPARFERLEPRTLLTGVGFLGFNPISDVAPAGFVGGLDSTFNTLDVPLAGLDLVPLPSAAGFVGDGELNPLSTPLGTSPNDPLGGFGTGLNSGFGTPLADPILTNPIQTDPAFDNSGFDPLAGGNRLGLGLEPGRFNITRNAADFDGARSNGRNGRGVTLLNDGNVGFFDDGDFLRFDAVDLGDGIDRVTVDLASPGVGGVIELRSGSPTGRLLGRLTPLNTGGYGVYDTQNLTLDRTVSGVQNLFLVGRGGIGIANLRSVSFGGVGGSLAASPGSTAPLSDPFMPAAATPTQPARLSFRAGEADASRGTRAVNGGNVGFLDNGDFLRFDNVDLNAGYDRVSIRLATPASGPGVLELRAGSTRGELLATLRPNATGGYGTYRTQVTGFGPAAGVQDLFLVARGGVGIANLDRVTLTRTSGTAATPTSPPPSTPGSTLDGIDPLTPLAANTQPTPIVDAGGFDRAGNLAGGITPRRLLDGGFGFLDNGGFVGFSGVRAPLTASTAFSSLGLRLDLAADRGFGSGFIDVRLGGPRGRLLGTIDPVRGSGFSDFRTQTVTLTDVPATLDTLFFVGRGGNAIANLRSFQLVAL